MYNPKINTNNISRLRSGQAVGKRKQILVTGGAGFLGSHLCERLISRGDTVTCLDNFITGCEHNVRALKASGSFRLIRQDVIEPFDFSVDEIYNLACPASPPRYQLDPVHTLKTSVLGAINVLDLAVRTNARTFQASTSEVYGDPEVHPQPETYWGRVNCFGPRACYDEGKRSAETLFYDYHHKKGVDIRIARIFNTYGPRMSADDGRVVSNFIVQALKGESITIHGDGSQTRSFCYVDDLIDGFLRLMDTPAPRLGPVNLGNSAEFTIRELAEIIIDITGSPSRIQHLPLPTDDPRQRRPDTGLAQQTLEWTPKIPLVEGLQRTIAYFDKVLGAPTARVRECAF
jgi:UDP-glucuronate decarboxylase